MHEDDVITITFDEAAVRVAALRSLIEGLGYSVETVEVAAGSSQPEVTAEVLPFDAIPEGLRPAFDRARRDGHLVVVDFWATWCPPCIRLKKETLVHPRVKKALTAFELVVVDLDEHPDLGRAWGVSSIPDVFILDADGRVLDRLREFEAAAPFEKRLKRVVQAHEADRVDRD